MRRLVIAIAALAMLGCQRPEGALGGVAAVFDGTGGTWVDLTHAFSAQTVYWPTDTVGFVHEQLAYGPTPAGHFYSSYRYSAAEHGGTHLDAPIHFSEGNLTADEIPLSRLTGAAVVIDVSARSNPDYQVQAADLTEWEAAHGQIPQGAIVLIRTGWESRYSDRAAYLGTDLTGPDAVAALHFPGIAPEAARWLVEQRKVEAVGLDTPSLDFGQSKDFQTHVILASAGVPGFENVAGLAQLPATGSYVVALPMKIAGGSGGPLRIVAFVPDSAE